MNRFFCALSAGLLAFSLASCGQSNGTAATTDAAEDNGVHEASLDASASFQDEVVFPDWAGYTDDTLAMNSMYSFKTYHGQGSLYITPAEGVESFELFINNHSIDTSQMNAGSTWEVDISNWTVDGTNTIQVSGITPSDLMEAVKVDIPYPTVLEGGTLEEAGISQASVDLIDQIIQKDIEHGFTSAQLAVVKDGRLVLQKAWGTVNAYNQDGSRKTDSAAVTNDTLYDLASNTKMYAVNYALQYLVSHEDFDLDTKIVDLVGPAFVDDTIDITYDGYENPGLDVNKAWKAELTVRDILRHQAGFPADPQYHNDAFNQSTQTPDPETENVLYSGSDGSEETRQKTLESICKTPLMYEPGTKTVYSDVDYMLLGLIIEKETGKDLNTFLKETFWDPMGLTRITYNPLDHGFTKDDCAATELNGNTRDGAISFTGVRTYTLQGEVHDEKAYYAMGGMSGHAGLFANATDLAKLASVMLTGGYGTNNFFSQNVMDGFTAPKREDAPSARWGLGWWREADNQRAWYFGTQSSPDTIGHQGWTGTLTMIDPQENLVIVYLTNKINSPVTDKSISANTFDGNWFTASTLGFVPQLLQMGLNTTDQDLTASLNSLLTDMVVDKYRLVNETAAETTLTKDHPLVQAAYSIEEVLFDHAEAEKSTEAKEACQKVIGLMDAERDADEIEALQARLDQLK